MFRTNNEVMKSKAGKTRRNSVVARIRLVEFMVTLYHKVITLSNRPSGILQVLVTAKAAFRRLGRGFLKLLSDLK